MRCQFNFTSLVKAVILACCAILLSAFALIGGSVVFPFVRSGHFLPATKFSSTDAYLADVRTKQPVSAALSDAFKSLPSRTRVLILYRGGDLTGTLDAQLVAYLAWPHDVQLILVAPHVLPPELQPDRLSSSGDAVIACRIPLPPHGPPRVIRLGEISGAFPAQVEQ
jgi:hypothetical protein